MEFRNARSGKLRGAIEGVTFPLTIIAWSPDGKRIVTASEDGIARMWDAQTGQPLGEPLKHAGGVISAEFSLDGKRIVTASRTGLSVRTTETVVAGVPRTPACIVPNLAVTLATAFAASTSPTIARIVPAPL